VTFISGLKDKKEINQKFAYPTIILIILSYYSFQMDNIDYSQQDYCGEFDLIPDYTQDGWQGFFEDTVNDLTREVDPEKVVIHIKKLTYKSSKDQLTVDLGVTLSHDMIKILAYPQLVHKFHRAIYEKNKSFCQEFAKILNIEHINDLQAYDYFIVSTLVLTKQISKQSIQNIIEKEYKENEKTPKLLASFIETTNAILNS
jgi:hypothetical protein